MYPIITHQAIFSATYEFNKSQTNGMVRLGGDRCGRLAQSVMLTQQPCHIQATEALQQRLVIDQGRAYDARYSWPGRRTRIMRTTGSVQGQHNAPRQTGGAIAVRSTWRGRAFHATDDRSQVHGADDAG